MRTIAEDIKNNSFKPVYLLYGEEDYLRKQYRDKLKNAIIPDDGMSSEMNFGYFEGKNPDTAAIIDMSETLPFFAERRLIIIENSGFFKSANDKINDYIDSIPETTIIVFVEKETDKRGKLFKKVKQLGYAAEMSTQTPATLAKWVVRLINDNNKKITKETLDYFLSIVGSDMNTISKEIEKLICYCMNEDVITTEHIKKITTEQISGKIFDMIDALGNKNQRKTLDLYYDLISTKEPPMRILFMLTRQFNIMLQVGELLSTGMSQKEIASKLALQPFIVGKVSKQLDNFKISTLKRALTEAVDTEFSIKSGNLNENTGVEMLLVKYSTMK